jgi:hypothetical protein
MKSITTPRFAAVAVCLLWLSAHSTDAQLLKEDRNNYPKPQPLKKSEMVIDKSPFIFSPHLSYKEQKKIQMAKKKVGGITFTIKTKKIQTSQGHAYHYKQPRFLPRRKGDIAPETVSRDTSEPYIRYELSDTTQQ